MIAIIFCCSVVLLFIWGIFVLYSETRFFDEQDSIKKWLNTHGFKIIYNRGDAFDTGMIRRLGSHTQYKIVKVYVFYWDLYFIKSRNESHDDTVRLINKLISKLHEYHDQSKENKDFWI